MATSKKFLCKKEIAALYGVSVKALSKVLTAHEQLIGKPVGYVYTPCQIEKIKTVIGGFEPIEKQIEAI
jgi:hypothetical protein